MRTRITLREEDGRAADGILAAIRCDGEPGTVDFETIIPSPPRGSLVEPVEETPGVLLYGRAQDEEARLRGVPTRMDWRRANWGTKWEAYDFTPPCELPPHTVEFSTAWHMPRPVVEALSRSHPDVVFHVLWADEDLGWNCGDQDWRAGTVVADRTPDQGTAQARRFAAGLWGCDGDDDGE